MKVLMLIFVVQYAICEGELRGEKVRQRVRKRERIRITGVKVGYD
jgi:hypothetical protein